MSNVIIVKDLSKFYGEREVVKHLNLNVNKGEIFGLLGHNGAGKSTSIECILGLKNFDKGTISILGLNPIKERKALFEKVGVQFQHTGYQHKIKVKEICEVTQSLYKSSINFSPLLNEFGLKEMVNQYVGDLYCGERQRLSVLLTLIPNPDVVFLDELTTGLDSKARRDIWKHLKKLKVKGLTIFLTSHYMDEVEALCNRIAILKNGELVAIGTVAELIDQSPYSLLEEAYLWYSGEEVSMDESI